MTKRTLLTMKVQNFDAAIDALVVGDGYLEALAYRMRSNACSPWVILKYLVDTAVRRENRARKANRTNTEKVETRCAN